MSIQDELDALPPKPKPPPACSGYFSSAFYEGQLFRYAMTRLVIAERLLERATGLCGMCGGDPHYWDDCQQCFDARAYLAKRKEEQQ